MWPLAGARVIPFNGAQPGGAALPVLGGVDGGAAGYAETLACAFAVLNSRLWVFELVLTPGSILEVTTVNWAGTVDGTALLVVEAVYHPDVQGVQCVVRLGGASRLLGRGSGLACSRVSIRRCQPWCTCALQRLCSAQLRFVDGRNFAWILSSSEHEGPSSSTGHHPEREPRGGR